MLLLFFFLFVEFLCKQTIILPKIGKILSFSSNSGNMNYSCGWWFLNVRFFFSRTYAIISMNIKQNSWFSQLIIKLWTFFFAADITSNRQLEIIKGIKKMSRVVTWKSVNFPKMGGGSFHKNKFLEHQELFRAGVSHSLYSFRRDI